MGAMVCVWLEVADFTLPKLHLRFCSTLQVKSTTHPPQGRSIHQPGKRLATGPLRLNGTCQAVFLLQLLSHLLSTCSEWCHPGSHAIFAGVEDLAVLTSGILSLYKGPDLPLHGLGT